MSDLPESRRARRSDARGSSTRRTIAWVVVVFIVIVIAAVAWVGIRGVLAERDLKQAVALAQTFKTQITNGDTTAARKTASSLELKAARAHRDTSDPVWRVAEVTPLVGSNLRAVRQIAATVDAVGSGAVKPLAGVLGSVNTASFKPVNGAVNLEPLVKAQPAVARAHAALESAAKQVAAINTSKTVSAIDRAVGQLQSTVTSTNATVAQANTAVQLAPSMMGASGQRNYLLLFENNAELRAGGGIPGAVAELHVDNGKISLGQVAAGSSFGPYTSSVMKLATDTAGLYGQIPGEYMQDVTLTPRFATSAQLAKAMWAKKYGTQVDGVLSLDPVTLSYILKATGPVKLATGDSLTSANAVPLLLSQTYARYSIPAEQDAFFASAASAVFQKVASGSFDPSEFISALARGVSERRVMLWSDHSTEQRRIAGTAAAGSLPKSTPASQAFGVYLNDATGAKMDYYLDETRGVGTKQCRKDGRPTWVVQVTLKSTAPADAATSLPEYVTGGGAFGVSPGETRTNIAIYAPKAGVFVGATQDGKSVNLQTATDGSYPVAQVQTLMKPGQTTTLRFEYVGGKHLGGAPVSVGGTPGINSQLAHTVAIDCENPLS